MYVLVVDIYLLSGPVNFKRIFTISEYAIFFQCYKPDRRIFAVQFFQSNLALVVHGGINIQCFRNFPQEAGGTQHQYFVFYDLLFTKNIEGIQHFGVAGSFIGIL